MAEGLQQIWGEQSGGVGVFDGLICFLCWSGQKASFPVFEALGGPGKGTGDRSGVRISTAGRWE